MSQPRKSEITVRRDEPGMNPTEPITAGQYAEILLGAEVARETPLGAAIEWALATIDEQAKEIARLKSMSEDWFRDEVIETLQVKLAAAEALLKRAGVVLADPLATLKEAQMLAIEIREGLVEAVEPAKGEK